MSEKQLFRGIKYQWSINCLSWASFSLSNLITSSLASWRLVYVTHSNITSRKCMKIILQIGFVENAQLEVFLNKRSTGVKILLILYWFVTSFDCISHKKNKSTVLWKSIWFCIDLWLLFETVSKKVFWQLMAGFGDSGSHMWPDEVEWVACQSWSKMSFVLTLSSKMTVLTLSCKCHNQKWWNLTF